jgi:hypothetical protein
MAREQHLSQKKQQRDKVERSLKEGRKKLNRYWDRNSRSRELSYRSRMSQEVD